MSTQTAATWRLGRHGRKLTPEQRAEIRRRYQPCPTMRDLAREYGVAQSVIWAAIHENEEKKK